MINPGNYLETPLLSEDDMFFSIRGKLYFWLINLFLKYMGKLEREAKFT